MIHSQHNTTDKEYNTTQNICGAECTSSSANTIYKLRAGSSTNKMHDLQHITHEDTKHYLHKVHTVQQNR